MTLQKAFIILINNTIRLLFILTLYSCTSLINLYEDNKELRSNRIKDTKLTCNSLDKLNIIHNSNYTINEFEIISTRLKENYNFSFIEVSLAYIIYQSIIRPDATSPYARAQYLIESNKKKRYYDLNYLNMESFEHSLSKISNDYKVRNLKLLIKQVKLSLPVKLTVQKNLHQYLSKNKKKLMHSQRFKHLFKLKNPLRVGETFSQKEINFKKSEYVKSYIPPPSFKLNISSNDKYDLQCNFDPGLYQNDIYILRKQEDLYNTFALNDSNENYFIAHTTSKSELQKSINNQTRYPAPICQYLDDAKDITLLAFNSKDPAQIMYHLINYDIFTASGPKEIIEYLNFPRHEILNNPNRIIFESKRSSQKQLEYFLSLNFPVYHSPSLGEIWSFIKIKDSTYYQYISDNRSPAAQSCLKK